MSFEVIKWVYNKTFVEIMKNTAYFPKKKTVYFCGKIKKVMSRSVRMSAFSS